MVAPHSSTAPAAATSRVIATCSPNPAASSSPRAIELSPRADIRLTTAPTARKGATTASLSHVAPPTPPICHDWNVPAMSLRGRMIAVTNEAKAADVAAPANASFSGVAPPRPNEPMT